MKNIFLSFLILFCLNHAFAQVSLVQFSAGYTAPLDIKNAGDDRMFIVEQAGRIKIADTAGVLKGTFMDISSKVSSGGERGLLGLAFDPDYKNNGFFYVNYTVSLGSVWETHISRFQVSGTNPDSADASSEKILLRIYQPYNNHKCGWLGFSPKDGYLYVGFGDGGSGGDPQNRAQNVDSLLGKIIRIDIRDTLYKIPPDNPLVGKAGRGEIWALGVRNPFRNSFDRWNGDLWIADVGQSAWEEVDYQKASSKGGENYGWRCYEGNHNYNTTGCGPMSSYVGPVYEYAHNGSAAIIGGYIYRGAEFANIFGKYFFSDQYTSNYGIRTLTPNGTGGFSVALLGSLGATTVVSFGEDRWGEMYVVDYGNGSAGQGRIWKLQGASCQPVAYAAERDTLFINGCDTTDLYGNPLTPLVLRTPDGRGFHYQWYADGMPVSGNDNDSFLVYHPGNYKVVVTNRVGCTSTSSEVKVLNPLTPHITIGGLDTVYCVYNAPVVISGIPAGGKFSGPGIGNDNSFSPIVAGEGYHTIIYSFRDSSSACSYSDSMIVHVDACLGINENRPLNATVYPNPNRGVFNIEIISLRPEQITLNLFDVSGRQIDKRKLTLRAGKQIFQIDANLPCGVYILGVENGKGQIYQRIIVQ